MANEQGAPTLGSKERPVNGTFKGPNAGGELFDVPPMSGYGPRPLETINGVAGQKLGIQDGLSIKTKG